MLGCWRASLLAVGPEHPDGRAQGEEERLAGVDAESKEYEPERFLAEGQRRVKKQRFQQMRQHSVEITKEACRDG